MRCSYPSRKTVDRAGPFVLLLILFCCSGATCGHALRNPFAQLGPPAPEVLAVGASLEQVIAAVNQNASRIQSYQTEDASISIHGVSGVPALRGNIALQRPGRVHLVASTALTGAEFDLGSNDELSWFWVKHRKPRALYYARHDQFVGSAAQQLMPIEPQWLLDALGMSQFSANDHHEGTLPRREGTMEIRSNIQTRTGPMTKSTVIDIRRAWVLQQHVYDGSRLLASSKARSHRYYPELGVSLPQAIDVHLPAIQLSLSIDVGSVRINTVSGNPALWRLPAYSGSSQIDLGSAPPGAAAAIGGAASSGWNTGASPGILGRSPGFAGNLLPVSIYSAGAGTQPVATARATPAGRIADVRQPVPWQTLTLDVPTSQPRTQGLHPAGVPVR